MQARNKYLAIVFDGVVKQESIRKIHKDIRKVTEAYKQIYDFVSYKLEDYCKKLAEKTERETSYLGLGLLAIADNVIEKWKKDDVFTSTNKIINGKVRDKESKDKDKAIKDFIRECRAKKEIFFLASSHDDSAEDHKDWQQKIYVDANWQKDIFFKKSKDDIRKFIRERNIRTFQWVTHKPVWFITRPNCRHFFVSLTFGEVKNHSIEELVHKYNTHYKIGQRQYQPIWHPTNQEWYTRENIEAIIEKYKERLTMHQALYKEIKSEELKRMIAKDKLLINKWVNMLATM